MNSSFCCWLCGPPPWGISWSLLPETEWLSLDIFSLSLSVFVSVCIQGHADHRLGSHGNLCGVVWGGENNVQRCQAAAHHTQVDRWWRWVCLKVKYCMSVCALCLASWLWLRNEAWSPFPELQSKSHQCHTALHTGMTGSAHIQLSTLYICLSNLTQNCLGSHCFETVWKRAGILQVIDLSITGELHTHIM